MAMVAAEGLDRRRRGAGSASAIPFGVGAPADAVNGAHIRVGFETPFWLAEAGTAGSAVCGGAGTGTNRRLDRSKRRTRENKAELRGGARAIRLGRCEPR